MTFHETQSATRQAVPAGAAAQDRTPGDQMETSWSSVDGGESDPGRTNDLLKARVLAGEPIVITKFLAGDDLRTHMRAIDDLIGDLGVPVTVIYTP